MMEKEKQLPNLNLILQSNRDYNNTNYPDVCIASGYDSDIFFRYRGDKYMRKNLILIVGKSGSGKDFMADAWNMTCVISRTTRKPRIHEVPGVSKVFISNSDMDNLIEKDELVAYTKRNEDRYGAIIEDIVNKDAYIIDPAGVEYMVNGGHPASLGLHLKTIYIYTSFYKRIYRMWKRKDGVTSIVKRIILDRKEFKNVKYDIKIKN